MVKVIVDLKNYLGNQVFQYLMVKSYATDNEIDFYYRSNVKAVFDKEDTNRSNLEQVFVIEDLRVENISNLPVFYYEDYIKLPHKVDSVVIGNQYITESMEKYINLGYVNKWLKFDNKCIELNKKWLDEQRNNNEVLVSCHFRCGSEYRKLGFKMNYHYWDNAAQYFIEKYQNVKFIVFYDQKTKYIKKFIKKYNCVICHKTLVDDLCTMSLCDSGIICNSTFSICAALLGSLDEIVSPNKFYAFGKTATNKMYMDKWKKLDCKISIDSIIVFAFYNCFEKFCFFAKTIIRIIGKTTIVKHIPTHVRLSIKNEIKKIISLVIKDYS